MFDFDIHVESHSAIPERESGMNHLNRLGRDLKSVFRSNCLDWVRIVFSKTICPHIIVEGDIVLVMVIVSGRLGGGRYCLPSNRVMLISRTSRIYDI